jgi:hypothetical protein
MKKDEYKKHNLVLNCTHQNFQGFPKMGDLIAVLNVFQYIRDINNNQTIKFYLPDDQLHGYDYVKFFKKYLSEKTDYFSETPGEIDLEGRTELWSFRERHGEFVKITNTSALEKKICLFPLLDAKYDIERNWSLPLLQQIIDEFSDKKYDEYSKILCCKTLPKKIDLKKFVVSYDFHDNINHINTAEYFIGGATGLSLYNSVLDDNKKSLYYYNHTLHGSWASVFCSPFYIKEKGQMAFYENDKVIKMLNGYIKNKDDLIHQVNYSKISYDKNYVTERYDTYGVLNNVMSSLRLGYITGTLGKIPESILDVGYGNGSFLKTCSTIIPKCYGSDISGYPLPENIQFVSDWVKTPVDVLTFFDALEHFDDPYILRNAKAKYIVVSVPWCHYHSEEWFLNWKHRRPNEHLWFFNEKSIFKFAKAIGCEIINYCNIEDSIRKNNNEKNILTFTMKKV